MKICQICGEDLEEHSQELLCSPCRAGLQFFHVDPELLAAAERFVRRKAARALRNRVANLRGLSRLAS